MAKENNQRHMPGPGMHSTEKAKDFKSAMKRLLKELKSYQVLIYISLILAALGSILSILAPNKLSKLTDEISKGLIVNKENLENLNKTIYASLPNFKEIEIDGVTISVEDQISYMNEMKDLNESSSASELYSKIDNLPDSIKSVVKPFMDIDKIKGIATFLIILYLCSALFTYIESISMTDVSNKFANKLRSSISKKINKLPL